MTGQDGVEVMRCPFDGCSWHREFDPDDEFSKEMADHDSEMHYEREHAGRIRVQVTLEREYLIGNRETEDVRISELERFEKDGYEVAHVRSEVLKEADDHPDKERAITQEDSPE